MFVLAALSCVVLELALPAAFLTFIALLALPARGAPGRRWSLRLLVAAALVAAPTTVAFVILRAMPGLVAGGQAATARAALTRLREVRQAEDFARKLHTVDPDGDGVGSALLLGELVGDVPLRGSEGATDSDTRLLARERFVHLTSTPNGPAYAAHGYLYIVCLPRRGGGFTAMPGEPVDDEAAERRFVAYAWPDSAQRHGNDVYFLDERETILVSTNMLDAREPRYAGPHVPPPCDAALAESTRAYFKPWRNKRPLAEVPFGAPSAR